MRPLTISTELPGLRARTPKALYRHQTRAGSFYIAPCRGGWEVQHGGASLGPQWATAEEALSELLAGRIRPALGGVDVPTLAIGRSLDDWERIGWVTGD